MLSNQEILRRALLGSRALFIILFVGICWMPLDASAQPPAPAGQRITHSTVEPIDSVALAGGVKNNESEPVRFSRLFAPAPNVRGLMDLQADGTIRSGDVQSPYDSTVAKGYSLLNDNPAVGTFQAGTFQYNYFPLYRWSSDSKFSWHEADWAPRPFFQLELGGWQLPVRLSNAAASPR